MNNINLCNKRFTCLCLSGGSAKGTYILGSLHYLNSLGLLDKIKYYIGTSIGAIICYLLIIGYTPSEILASFCTSNLSDHYNKISPLNLINDFGVYNYEPLRYQVECLTLKKLDKIPTLRELYNMYNSAGKMFTCVAFNLSKKQTEYISHLTNPDLSVLDAIRMSSNIPLIFNILKINNMCYIDGGVSDNFPIHYATQHFIDGDILGITLEKSMSEKSYSNILEYIYDIVLTPFHVYRELQIDKKIPNRVSILELKVDNIMPYKLSLDTNTILRYFHSGINQTKTIAQHKIKRE